MNEGALPKSMSEMDHIRDIVKVILTLRYSQTQMSICASNWSADMYFSRLSHAMRRLEKILHESGGIAIAITNTKWMPLY